MGVKSIQLLSFNKSSNYENTSDSNSQKSETGSKKIELTDIFGEYGRYQIILCGILMYSTLLGNWNVVGYTFYIFPMDHWCARPQNLGNISVENWKNSSIPREVRHGKDAFSTCTMFDPVNLTGTHGQGRVGDVERVLIEIPCDEWEFDKSFFKSTIISQWSLTCQHSWKASMSQSVYMTGFLIAVLLFGKVGDKYGRKPVLIICVILQQVAGLAAAFSPNFAFFVVMRFFIAMGVHGFFTTAYVVLTELVSSSVRPKVGVSLGVGWSVGFLLLPALGWFTRSWSLQQLVLAICSVVLSITFWLIPESPRWLIATGQYDEARKVIERAAKMNGVYNEQTSSLIDECFENIEKERVKLALEKGSGSKATVLDLVRTPNLRKVTLNLFLVWFVTAFVYYALALNTHSLGGDPLVNIAISGIAELPCLLVYYLVIKYIGRRLPLAFFLVLAGCSCLFTIPVTSEDLMWLKITLVMLGKSCVSVCFGIIYMYSVELFPTVVRNFGVGSCSTLARVGSIIAPFVKELGHATSDFVPLLIYGGVTVVSGLLVLFLPETTDRVIPDTIEEAEYSYNNEKSNKS